MRKPKDKFAWTARVGDKGQIVIPKEARDLFEIEPGDTVLLLGDIKKGIAIVRSDQLAAITRLALGDLLSSIPSEDTQEE